MICLDFIYDAIRYKHCKHRYCKSCIKAWNKKNGDYKCALCRHFSDSQEVVTDMTFTKRVMKLFPVELESRMPKPKVTVPKVTQKKEVVEEVKLEPITDRPAASLMKLCLVFTYTSRLIYPGITVNGNRKPSVYAWKVDLDIPGIDKHEVKLLVDHVQYDIPETYRNSTRAPSKFPFSVNDKGTENVEIKAKVFWNSRFGVSPVESTINVNFTEPQQTGARARPRTGVHNKKTKRILCQVPKKYSSTEASFKREDDMLKTLVKRRKWARK